MFYAPVGRARKRSQRRKRPVITTIRPKLDSISAARFQVVSRFSRIRMAASSSPARLARSAATMQETSPAIPRSEIAVPIQTMCSRARSHLPRLRCA